MSNNEILLLKFKELKNKYESQDFVLDKSGVKTVELLNTFMNLDPMQPILDLGFRKSQKNYINQELRWYLSQSLNIHPIMDDVKIWNQVCSTKGFVNSNYGWCIYSKENFSQYDYAIETLKKDKTSRRSCMMYNRPSMTNDFNKDGMSDYTCTIYTQLFIRDDKLIYNVKQRSCDIVFGFFNDFAWHCYVYEQSYKELCKTYENLQIGHINYNIDSLHLYERHFNFFGKF